MLTLESRIKESAATAAAGNSTTDFLSLMSHFGGGSSLAGLGAALGSADTTKLLAMAAQAAQAAQGATNSFLLADASRAFHFIAEQAASSYALTL